MSSVAQGGQRPYLHRLWTDIYSVVSIYEPSVPEVPQPSSRYSPRMSRRKWTLNRAETAPLRSEAPCQVRNLNLMFLIQEFFR